MSNSALKKGFFWSFLDSVSVQIITFIFGIILARLLSPKEFGIIGMVMVFIAVSNIFVSSGFSDALMRKKEIKPIELNTVFWFNLSISIILYVLLYGGAGVISNFFETPLLIDVIRLLGLGIIINALILVQRVILTKQMDFKTLTKISVSSTLFSGACAIIMAYQGYGVWSLVAKTLIAQLVTLILMVLFNSWRPQVKFDFIVFKGMFTFGSRLLLLGLLDTLYSNIYYLIIGKVYSPAQLGFYTRAESLKNLPSKTLTNIVQKVSYPVLAAIQDDKKALRDKYQLLVTNTMFLGLLGMVLLASIAKPFAVITMGEQWAQAGYYLEILCFSGLFYPLDALNSNILKIMNRSDILLKVGIWRKLLGIPVIFIAIYAGIIPMLYSLILHQLISYLLISNYSKGFINYGTVEQVKDFGPFLLVNLLLYSLLKLFPFEIGMWQQLIFVPILYALFWLVAILFVLPVFRQNLLKLIKNL